MKNYQNQLINSFLFDKKVITPKNKDYQIRMNYIQTKIEEQNSDILYLIK